MPTVVRRYSSHGQRPGACKRRASNSARGSSWAISTCSCTACAPPPGAPSPSSTGTPRAPIEVPVRSRLPGHGLRGARGRAPARARGLPRRAGGGARAERSSGGRVQPPVEPRCGVPGVSGLEPARGARIEPVALGRVVAHADVDRRADASEQRRRSRACRRRRRPRSPSRPLVRVGQRVQAGASGARARRSRSRPAPSDRSACAGCPGDRAA